MSGDEQPSETPGENQPPAQPVFPAEKKAMDPDRKAFLRASMLAAAIGTGAFFLAGMLTMGAVAVQPLVLLLMIATGGLAVTLYTHKVPAGINTSKGLRLGLLTGFFGALLMLAISMLGLASTASRDEFRKTVTEALNTSAAASADPAAHDVAAKLTAGIGTTGGLVVFMLLMMALVAVLYLVLSGLGGAVGAALFGRPPHSDQESRL